MGIWFLAHNSATFCVQVQETTSCKLSTCNLGFGHVKVIWYNWAISGPNMGVATVGGWGPRPPQKFGHGSQLTGQLLSRKQVSLKN